MVCPRNIGVAWAPEGGDTRFGALRLLESGPRGLTEAQAERRLLAHGENVVPAHRPVSWPRRLARSLRDPFTMVLLALGVVSALIASWGTAGVIVLLVAASCLLRSNGEHRADRSTAALRELVASTVTVRRRPDEEAGPREREIPVDELVPGDVIKLGPGDVVPADVRLLRASGLTVHQAALTGESEPVPKQAHDLPEGTDHLLWQGSSVASGTATAVVTATGAATLYAGAQQAPARKPSAFDRSVNGISWILVRVMLVIPPVALVANALLHGKGLEALPFAVAVAVGLTPEMLPVVVTTALARGAALLAGDGVIVKRLPALHDVGAIDVLCVDKTGTLTQDRPVLSGSVGPDGRADPAALRWAAVNSFWTLHLTDPPTPDPLDEAILDAAPDPGDVEGLRATPFDPTRKLSCALVRTDEAAAYVVVVKGAVEAVLDRCAMSEAERARAAEVARALAGAGARVLAVATAESTTVRTAERMAEHAVSGTAEEAVSSTAERMLEGRAGRAAGRAGEGTRDHRPDEERGLRLVGFVTLVDALSPEAADALAVLAGRGIAVKVLTGDHPATAARVCRDLGLKVEAVADAASLTPRALERATVIARCTPEDKARVVTALREAGHTVGFLGDGSNDRPAMRVADVGICPRSAVDVTREAADIVLAAKDLTAVDQAVLAGRRSTGNIITYLRIALSSNVGNVIAMLAAGLAFPFLPMLPIQVLLQNVCFDAAQLSFAFDRAAPATLRRPLRLRPNGIVRFIVGFGVLNALVDLATFAVLTWGVRAAGRPAFHTGWFIENLLTQAVVMLLLRPTIQVSRPLGLAAGALAVVGLLLPLSPLAGVFGLVALPAASHAWLLLVVVLYGGGLLAINRRTGWIAERS
ncbi:magnesium-translocating P-type ATPase [Nonomuraea sp. FMUSA5-5]|uniref:Magnesium-transporting ATPase, P-type 1 n=1 Tax=Nonomuraea composti TaxID=2720023 RepID=A0ABX1B7N2_9ACTN|nr:magnesium-translocating P-type ATPase [Nonomuraea sp. FMUSA5-5]